MSEQLAQSDSLRSQVDKLKKHLADLMADQAMPLTTNDDEKTAALRRELQAATTALKIYKDERDELLAVTAGLHEDVGQLTAQLAQA